MQGQLFNINFARGYDDKSFHEVYTQASFRGGAVCAAGGRWAPQAAQQGKLLGAVPAAQLALPGPR